MPGEKRGGRIAALDALYPIIRLIIDKRQTGHQVDRETGLTEGLGGGRKTRRKDLSEVARQIAKSFVVLGCAAARVWATRAGMNEVPKAGQDQIVFTGLRWQSRNHHRRDNQSSQHRFHLS